MFKDKTRIEYYKYRIIAQVNLSCLCRSRIRRRYQILSDPRDKREISEFSADKENPPIFVSTSEKLSQQILKIDVSLAVDGYVTYQYKNGTS